MTWFSKSQYYFYFFPANGGRLPCLFLAPLCEFFDSHIIASEWDVKILSLLGKNEILLTMLIRKDVIGLHISRWERELLPLGSLPLIDLFSAHLPSCRIVTVT